MGQTWKALLFAHWRVPYDALRQVVPAQLPLDEIDGSAWVGITPFEASSVRPRLTAPLPWLSWFPELNVRTYVTVGGKPGIYFFSLDAARRSAVWAARLAYRLPYFSAKMSLQRRGDRVRFASVRSDSGGPPGELAGRYRPRGRPFEAAPGTLERELTERYCLYTLDEGRRVLRAEIHHRPWPLQRAEAAIERNTMAHEIGLELGGEPLLHFAARQDVVFWPLAVAEPDAAEPQP